MSGTKDIVGVAILEALGHVLCDLLLHLGPRHGGEGRLVLVQGGHGVEGGAELPLHTLPDARALSLADQRSEGLLVTVHCSLVVPRLLLTNSAPFTLLTLTM